MSDAKNCTFVTVNGRVSYVIINTGICFFHGDPRSRPKRMCATPQLRKFG